MERRVDLKDWFVISVFLLAIVGAARAETIIVRADGSGDYPTIQMAINNANVDDEVELQVGTYTGDGNRNINFLGKAITVRSTDPNDSDIVEATIIDCESAGYGFVFNSGETTQTILSGLSITNATDGAIWLENQSNPTIRKCNLYGNTGSQVIMCKGSSPYIKSCIINNNQTPVVDVAVLCIYQGTGPSSLIPSDPTIEQCSINNNSGGGLDLVNSSPIIRNTRIIGNYYFGVRGQNSTMPYPDHGFTPMFENCLIAGNWDSQISFTSFFSASMDATFKNCTFTGTMGCSGCDGGGAAIKLSSSVDTFVARLKNCIVSHNSLYPGGNGLPEISLGGASKMYIDYSNIQGGQAAIDGGTVVWGVGNLDTDPNYIDPGYWYDPIPGEYDDDTWVEGNHRLNRVSVCIDAGDNSLVSPDSNDMDGDGNITEPIPYDLDEQPRIVDGDCNSTDIVDMGAYEFSYVSLGDFAGGCDVDFADFAVLALAWLTENGQAGYDSNCDIAFPYDKAIDEKDLQVFTDNWLFGK